MARYRGTLRGLTGRITSRLGGPSGGLFATANGWNIGAEIHIRPNSQETGGNDEVSIRLTRGSASTYASQLIGNFTLKDFNECLSDFKEKIVREMCQERPEKVKEIFYQEIPDAN